MTDPKKVAQLVYLFSGFRWLREEVERYYAKYPTRLTPEARKAFDDILYLEIGSFKQLIDTVYIDFNINDNQTTIKIEPPDEKTSLQAEEIAKIKLKALMHLLKKCKSDIKNIEQPISWLFTSRQVIRKLYQEVETEYKKIKPKIAKLDAKERKDCYYFGQGIYLDSL